MFTLNSVRVLIAKFIYYSISDSKARIMCLTSEVAGYILDLLMKVTG